MGNQQSEHSVDALHHEEAGRPRVSHRSPISASPPSYGQHNPDRTRPRSQTVGGPPGMGTPPLDIRAAVDAERRTVFIKSPGGGASSSPRRSASGGEHKVPTVFRWNGEGSRVFVSGTFNKWQTRIPLNRTTHGDFVVIVDVPPGVHHYRFFVDGHWRHADDQFKATDERGCIHNTIEVTEIRRPNAAGVQATLKSLQHSPPGDYGFVREAEANPGAPHLPPHLHRALLNTNTNTSDPGILPMPHHVMLNHLYVQRTGDGSDAQVLGVTHRYREKFITTVYFRPAAPQADAAAAAAQQ